MNAETLVDPTLSFKDLSTGEIQASPEITPEQIETVAMRLSPRSEIDDHGLNRTVFEYQGITFAFTGREETPSYHTLEESRPTYLGRESVALTYIKEKPILSESQRRYFRDHQMSEEDIEAVEAKRVGEWQAEHDRFTNFSNKLHDLDEKNIDKPGHLLVEQSAYGLFALLERLQPDNPHWKAQKDAVASNQYDAEALLFIDMVTAVDSAYLGENADSVDEHNHPPVGEAVVLVAILGDEGAQRLAMQAVTMQEQKEVEKLAKEHEVLSKWRESSEGLKNAEEFKPEDLVVVHATSFEPKVGQQGYEVQTTHDATGFPRASVHTALNHKVESHLFGSWDDRDYVLVAGLDQMLEVNGSPNSINGTDTWWTRNPGERLAFPGGTLIGPGEGQLEVVIRSEGRTSYKTEGFTHEDIEIIGELFGPNVKGHIVEMLKDQDGKTIDISSEDGKRIIANVLRDALVTDEITRVRGKELLSQDDDKFMPQSTQRRLDKMAANLGLQTSAGLHNGSQESNAEDVSSNGERIFGMTFSDPKVRRTAYASGMMGAGGMSRQLYLRRKASRESGMD